MQTQTDEEFGYRHCHKYVGLVDIYYQVRYFWKSKRHSFGKNIEIYNSKGKKNKLWIKLSIFKFLLIFRNHDKIQIDINSLYFEKSHILGRIAHTCCARALPCSFTHIQQLFWEYFWVVFPAKCPISQFKNSSKVCRIRTRSAECTVEHPLISYSESIE